MATTEPEDAAFFVDLNLDQVITSMTARRDEYNLTPLFRTRLGSADAIRYRHEVMRDLHSADLLDAVRRFAARMRDMRGQLARAEKLHYRRQQQRCQAQAVATYCEAVSTLAADLTTTHLRSRALRGLRAYLTEYAGGCRFTTLLAETRQIEDDLAAIRYNVRIKGSRVTVSDYGEEPDYSAEIEATFDKFKRAAAKDYRVKFHNDLDMNHIEARILDLVAQQHPAVFSRLDDYCQRHREHVDETVARFDRELQFYLGVLEHVWSLESDGLPFCYPELSERTKDISVTAAFDLALAGKLATTGAPVVHNDFHLRDDERVFVVSGPNQGGKTTFARTFGQLHYLAALGCPVPGKRARLFVFDRLFTHFEKEESLETLRGKLQDDLYRIHDVLSRATGDSIIIMNELFTSTTVHDALSLGQKVLDRITRLGSLGVYVTFLDELSRLNEATVSMVSTVRPDDPAERTYKVVRRPADGRSYAVAIAEKYGLSYEALRRRIAS